MIHDEVGAQTLFIFRNVRAMPFKHCIKGNVGPVESLFNGKHLVARERTGTISGSYTESVNTNSDMIVAYAYKKGTYNANVEKTTAQGEDEIRFKNAVTSGVVKSDLTHSFKLAYLEEGEYEIHFAWYQHDSGTGKFTFQSMLDAETTANGSIGGFVTVEAGISISVVSTISGTL